MMTDQQLRTKFDTAKRLLEWDKQLKIIKCEGIRNEYAIALTPLSIPINKPPTELRTQFMPLQQLYDIIQGAIYQHELRFYSKKIRKKNSTRLNPILKTK